MVNYRYIKTEIKIIWKKNKNKDEPPKMIKMMICQTW